MKLKKTDMAKLLKPIKRTYPGGKVSIPAGEIGYIDEINKDQALVDFLDMGYTFWVPLTLLELARV